ncbi:MAG: carboxypeptidase-like regulatory domain-containing protein [Cyanobacteria bacterium J06649_4]
MGVPVEFDVIEYAVVLSPPWLNQPRSSPLQTDLPVIVEGLPTVASPRFSISAMRQRTTISGRGNNLEQITTQGDLSITGNALGGSWYVRTEQPEIGDRTTWRFSEAQYLQQTDSADYVIGSQPTFWPNQGSGSYWGATTIQRFGFEPMSPGHGGFSPQRRLQSDGIGRTIAGEATPGSVAQLVIGSSNIVVDEVLVDSSGVYRFEQVSTAKVRQFQVRLYPNGQLTAEPEIRRAEFLALPGQLTAGSSALLLSAGARQHSNGAFTGRFQDPTGGLAYRWGASEDLTLGIGAVYDESLLGFSELLYQPANAPLRVAISTLAGAQGLRYNANAYYNPSSRFDLTLSSDELSQRFRANWRVGPKFTMRASGNTRENALSIGASASINRRNFFLSGSGDLDTNGNLRWSLNSKWNRLRLSHRGNELTTNTELSYAFSRLPSAGLTAFLAYDTRQLNTTQSDFFQVGTRYRSYQRNQRGLNLWQFNLGYGVGSAGQGIQLAASTTAIPGLTMQARYQAISAFSDQPTFSVEISPTFNLQPALSLSDTTPETLRGRGSILVQPFFDTNNNGVKDESETVYTEDTDLLVLIDNQSAQRFSPNITSQGLIVHTEPGTHRLDLDPAGYPLDWKPTQRAYAVDVTAGGQTLVSLPLSQAYTLVGSVVNEQNEPISGATIEAVAQQGELPSASSVTNRAGVFLLEGLSQDAYQLLINGQPAQPGEIEFHIDSPTFQELNLLLSQTSRS